LKEHPALAREIENKVRQHFGVTPLPAVVDAKEENSTHAAKAAKA
jgi:hypothetical protein